jgi:uncharacterized membrane protein
MHPQSWLRPCFSAPSRTVTHLPGARLSRSRATGSLGGRTVSVTRSSLQLGSLRGVVMAYDGGEILPLMHAASGRKAHEARTDRTETRLCIMCNRLRRRGAVHFAMNSGFSLRT